MYLEPIYSEIGSKHFFFSSSSSSSSSTSFSPENKVFKIFTILRSEPSSCVTPQKKKKTWEY